MAMTKETYEEVKNAESMVASFSYNSYDKHGGRTTQEEEKNWAAKRFIQKWSEENVHGYADDEAMRYGGSAYGRFEMEQIAEHAFLMGRLYGRVEKAQEKNKVIAKLKKTIAKLSKK